VRVVCAPDKFKGCLTAVQVAEALARGLTAEQPHLQVRLAPVADGGDGTVAAALSAGFTRRTVTVAGPTGRLVEAPYAIDGRRAVVELAAAVGLDRLPEGRLDPLGASTYGLGQVIDDAIGHGATQVVLGVGGSASTDGGAGMAQALGARLVDAAGREVGRGGRSLGAVAAVDLDGLRSRLGSVELTVASDVDNPLLGPNGAAAVFGPQKGATPAEVEELEQALRRWSQVVADAVGTDRSVTPGAGAAGGTGFAAVALLGATIRPGIELVLELLGFTETVRGADLVVTGEGSLDGQSLAGKAPIGVTRLAAGQGIPVVAVAGRSLLTADQLRAAGLAAAYPLSDLEPDPARSIANAGPLLTAVGRRIAREWLR
jgi:glycerate kinase